MGEYLNDKIAVASNYLASRNAQF